MPRPKDKSRPSVTAARAGAKDATVPGNRLWKIALKPKRGAVQRFETPEELLEAVEEYFEWLDENPLYEAKPFFLGSRVKMVNVPKPRPALMKALCAFIGISTDAWRRWHDEREDLRPVLELVDDLIYEHKYAGAATGLFNAGLIGRDLGLADKQELSGPNGGPMEVEETRRDAADFTSKLSRLAATRGAREGAGDPKP